MYRLFHTSQYIVKIGGFMLEALMEALPQSILQLIAMVYYREMNVISIGSILLSMTSIMTKCFVISQGVEWKSYLFCWLCVITDFFSIFFIVSWVFLSNEHINGNFLGYFSIIGELWCIKIAISILPPIIAVACGWIFGGYWVFMCNLYRNNSTKPWYQIAFYVFFWTVCGNTFFVIGFGVCSIMAGLFAEIICFTIIAAAIFILFTQTRWDYTDEESSKIICEMLNFVSNASFNKNNDRIIRILCLNHAYYSMPNLWQEKDYKLKEFIEQQHENDTLNNVTYKDIRENCYDTENAMIFKVAMKEYLGIWVTYTVQIENASRLSNTPDRIMRTGLAVGVLLLAYVAVPIYILSRIFSIIFPYFLVVYICYYQLFWKLDSFELTMLGVYLCLQLMVFILAIFVIRIHLWLWHILPSRKKGSMGLHLINKNDFMQRIYKHYDEVQWLPFAQEIVLQRFGKDIGGIIVEYLKAMKQLKLQSHTI